MNSFKPQDDLKNIDLILKEALANATQFIQSLPTRSPGIQTPPTYSNLKIPTNGNGAIKALELFKSRYESQISASSGPRNLSFVVGGTTPAALLGDWLTSTYDLNLSNFGNSIAPWIELETLSFLKDLLKVDSTMTGIFLTGATVSNFVGLAQGREWCGKQLGISISRDGLYGLPKIPIYSGAIHSSSIKSMSMLGMGRSSLISVPLMQNRECIDVDALEKLLQQNKNQPSIVVANAGTVNTGDFDSIPAIHELKKKYSFWLHVDAAFGGMLRYSDQFSHLCEGLELADSITVDLHKWLNVPYDSAIALSKHPEIQKSVFENNAAYLNQSTEQISFSDLGPENSRRFRALPTWFTLQAYGVSGYAEIVNRCIENAAELGKRIESSSRFKLMSKVHSNIVCFKLSSDEPVEPWLKKLADRGKVFLTKTKLQNEPAIRAAFVNWNTQKDDLEIIWSEMNS